MSRQHFALSADLKQLEEDGFELQVLDGHLLVGHIPFRDADAKVAYGTLVMSLDETAGITRRPDNHQARFCGGVPHTTAGIPWDKINEHGPLPLFRGMIAACGFSAKPPVGHYVDYYEKVTTYVGHISGPAELIDPTATALTGVVPPDPEEISVFHYEDNASSRAQITGEAERLAGQRIAIVGLGGTGSYILDAVAKTRVTEIHLYDGDSFEQHNAFRAPGAWSLDDLRAAGSKVDVYDQIYSRLRTGIHAHPEHIGADNVVELGEMNFVFLSMEGGEAKRIIIDALDEFGIPFIDVGLGVQRRADGLAGMLRVNISTPERRSRDGISFATLEREDVDEYAANIQIAELNMLNAALAVARWKRHCGYFSDLEKEQISLYSIDGNHLANEGGV